MVGIHLSDAPPSTLADFTIPTDALTEIVALRESLCTVFADGFRVRRIRSACGADQEDP